MSWFTPKCPVTDDERRWIDGSFAWLIDEIGEDVILGVTTVLPTEEFFPDPYSGSRSDIKQMVYRVCEYMDVDSELLVIRFYESEDATDLHPFAESYGKEHALGTYRPRSDGKHLITLETRQASNPEMMAATIAHELGHVILHGEGRLDDDCDDHEPLTDLLTVFYGMGIFSANTTLVFEQWTNQQYQGWRIGGGGYLTEQMYGYALAFFASFREESKPVWMKYLNANIRSYMKRSLPYVPSVEDIKRNIGNF